MAKLVFQIEFTFYAYKGVTRLGDAVKGTQRAESIEKARAIVESQGISVQEIKKLNPLLIPKGSSKKIDKTEVNIFFRQMATMLDAGIPLVQALEFVAVGVESLQMASLIMSVHKQVSAGSTFADSLRTYPQFFGELVCSLIKVGEQSGTLDTVLDRVAAYLERMEVLVGRIKKAMFYPIIMLVVMLSLAGLLLTFVVPKFQGMFASFGKELPGPTLAVIAASNFLQHYWWLVILTIVIIVIVHKSAKKRSERYRYFLAKASINIFVFGPLIRKASISRVVSTLSISLAAGIPLVEALECVARVSGNLLYTDAIYAARDDVRHGGELAKALEVSKLFPAMVTQMISIGEKSGALEVMLTKISEFYDEQVNSMVDALSTLLEPIMIILLGVIVGGFVISMYLPIFKIGTLV